MSLSPLKFISHIDINDAGKYSADVSWHNVCTKSCENWSSGLKIRRGERRLHGGSVSLKKTESGQRVVYHVMKTCCRMDLFLGAVAELQKATNNFVISVCTCVCPHGTSRLLLDGFYVM
jgi:hypothetical protein